jgi:hypothetical protein
VVVVPTEEEAKSLVRLFEELGFESRHSQLFRIKDGMEAVQYIMKDANNNEINIMNSPIVSEDVVRVRINVDNFTEAYDFLTDHGYINTMDGLVYYSGSSLTAPMVSRSGLGFSLVQHIKNKKN